MHHSTFQQSYRVILLMTLFVLGACISEKPGVAPPKDVLHYPISIAVHPAKHYAAVVNADFNQAYQNGTVVFIDLKTLKLVPEWTVPIGLFGAEIAFNPQGTRMFVAVRGEFTEQDGIPAEPTDVLVSYDVDSDVAKLDPGSSPILVPGSRRATQIGADPYGVGVDQDGRYIYVAHLSGGELTVLQDDLARFVNEAVSRRVAEGEEIRLCLPETLSWDSVSMTEDPYLGLSCESDSFCGETVYIQSTEIGGETVHKSNYCLLDPRKKNAKHCATFCELDRDVLDQEGQTLKRGCPEGFRCETVRPMDQKDQRKFSPGGNQVVVHPMTGTVYISSLEARSLGLLRPYYAEGQGFKARVENLTIASGYDCRGMAFDPAGDRLYVAMRNTSTDSLDRPMLAVLDTSVTASGCSRNQFVGNSTTCERNKTLGMIEVPDQPANMVYYRHDDKETMYVTSFAEDKLLVVDLNLQQVVEVVDLAPSSFIEQPGIFRHHASPYDLDTYENEAGVWALVANFQAHEVAVVQLFDQQGNPINRVDRKIENRAKLYEEDQF